MNYNVPERPIPMYQQKRKEAFAFYPLLLLTGTLMLFGSIALFEGILEKVFCLVSCYLSFWISSYVSENMRKEYEKKSDAWHAYWGDYWEEERLLRIEIDRLPEFSEDRQLLEAKLGKMHSHYDRHYC